MRANLSKIIFPLLSAAVISVVLTGCGPGFPIMTREQETLEDNVNRIVKENAALKKRLDSIEGGGSASLTELNRNVEELKRTVAETSLGLDKTRQDFSFVQGKLDETGHEGEKYKDSMKSASESLASNNKKLAALEAQAAENDRKFESIRASLEAQAKNNAEIRESLQSIEKRTAAAEAKLAGLESAPVHRAKKETKAEPEALYLKGYQEVVDKNYAAASETMANFLAEYPEHKFAGNAQYWLGEIYYVKGDWEKAILEFDKVIKKYPTSEKIAASLLKQGFAFDKIGSKKESKVLLGSVMERFPKSPEAGLAKKKLDSMK
ncbi:MAG: tol-pal system protein YbgF [Deltaproteobacteria bacterium]|nr:tol-pal system protein YbgF [Deltaproteobacteria bacterium]